ncbi:NPC intracellular cholesterol transporter 2-like [Tachypleus tridentatus]|uniref:NPC intracellular cholesterol transporter 2-like n=1 Tax=Tachypleus tridentatus TaxID=6853 RepID=UPI003FD0A284
MRVAVTISLLLVVVVVNGKTVSFTDCGINNVYAVRVTPCPTEPCALKKSSSVLIEADFKAPITTDEIVTVIRGNIRGKKLTLPGGKRDPCKEGSFTPPCPIIAGKNYTYRDKLEVADFYPQVPITVKYSLTDVLGEMVTCAEVKTVIVKN